MDRTWRLLDTGVRDAASNMCLDRAVLEARARGQVGDTLRFLQFSPPAVLVGYHQSVDLEVRRDYCAREGIEVNRRITGGGAILFDRTQLGWEVIAGRAGMPGDAVALGELVCRGLIEGLSSLGVRADFRPVNDVEVGGRKISGTGGTASGDAFLFQGTLLVDFDVDTMVRALRIPTEKLRDKEVTSIRERVTCLRWLLGEAPPLDAIKSAVAGGFARALGVEFEPGPLVDAESAFLEAHVDGFRQAEWVDRVRRPMRTDRALYSVHKAPGGLIRTSLLLDDARDVIKYVLITGDFFAFPETTVFDLEGALKSCPVARLESRVRSFFEERRPEMPGVTPDDILRALRAALRKRRLQDLGLTSEEASSVHEVNDALERMGEATVVLLPYCAKWVGCALRYDEDCVECGGCTVGVAYELARRSNMEPVTIVNFEHLQAVLAEMRRAGVRSYLGCCCEPFFAKHWRDLEEAGVAGLLVDVTHTTCYELDKEREAKQGRFEGQTELDVALLRKLFSGEGGGKAGVATGGPGAGGARDGGDAEAIKSGKRGRRALYADDASRGGAP